MKIVYVLATCSRILDHQLADVMELSVILTFWTVFRFVTGEVCISSVKNNEITYTFDSNNSVFTEKEVLSLDDFGRMRGALAVIIKVATANTSFMDQEKRNFEYVVSEEKLMLTLTPELFDSLTFGFLSYTERITSLSLTLLTLNICTKETNDDSENLRLVLEMLLSPVGLQYVEKLQHHDVGSSGVLLFMPVGILSVLIVFLLVPSFFKCISDAANSRGKSSDGKSANTEEKRQTMLPVSTKEDPIMIVFFGGYFVSICCCVAYLAYWIAELTVFIGRDSSDLNLLLASEQKILSTFIINCVFLSLLCITSVTVTLVTACKQERSSNLNPCCKLFIYVGSSSMVMLLTCATYHCFFLLVSLAIDYKTTISGTLYLLTLIIAAYSIVPTILMQFIKTKQSKEYAHFFFSSFLLFLILGLYCLFSYALESVGKKYTVDIPQLIATTVSSSTTLALIAAVSNLIFSKQRTITKPKLRQNVVERKNIIYCDPGNHKAKQLLLSLRSRRIHNLTFLMFSDPVAVIVMLQNCKSLSLKNDETTV